MAYITDRQKDRQVDIHTDRQADIRNKDRMPHNYWYETYKKKARKTIEVSRDGNNKSQNNVR